jgi:hypothetical protein
MQIKSVMDLLKSISQKGFTGMQGLLKYMKEQMKYKGLSLEQLFLVDMLNSFTFIWKRKKINIFFLGAGFPALIL